MTIDFPFTNHSYIDHLVKRVETGEIIAYFKMDLCPIEDLHDNIQYNIGDIEPNDSITKTLKYSKFIKTELSKLEHISSKRDLLKLYKNGGDLEKIGIFYIKNKQKISIDIFSSIFMAMIQIYMNQLCTEWVSFIFNKSFNILFDDELFDFDNDEWYVRESSISSKNLYMLIKKDGDVEIEYYIDRSGIHSHDVGCDLFRYMKKQYIAESNHIYDSIISKTIPVGKIYSSDGKIIHKPSDDIFYYNNSNITLYNMINDNRIEVFGGDTAYIQQLRVRDLYIREEYNLIKTTLKLINSLTQTQIDKFIETKKLLDNTDDEDCAGIIKNYMKSIGVDSQYFFMLDSI